ncbi:unnamed protein product, partial [Closterium sp. NIES-53]
MGAMRTPSKKAPAGLFRFGLRFVILLFVVVMVVFIAETRKLADRQRKSEFEELREQSLRKILRQHEMEIQAAIDKNIGWFSHYLSRLRLSSRAGAGR